MFATNTAQLEILVWRFLQNLTITQQRSTPILQMNILHKIFLTIVAF
jgi:hypothetical protein